MAKDFFFIPLGGSGGGGGDLSNYYTKSQVDTLIQDFITRSVNDLVNYYTKSETYTQAEVNTLIGSIESIHFEFAASTSDVQDPQSNVIYLIGPSGTGADQYEEYVYANNQWKKIGDTSIDLSNYATLTDLQNAINTAMATSQQYAVENFYQKSEVDTMLDNAVSGLQDEITPQNPLSADLLTNGSTNKVFTDTEKTKLAGIEAGAQANVQSNWNETDTSDPSYIQNKPNIADTLQGMRDVTIATPQNGQVLKFNSTTNQWENANESGGGVETVELTELTSEKLGELYEIVVNEDPISIVDYLAEHRLVAYGMPVTSWDNTTYSISTYEELVEDEEGNAGAAFYTDTNIIKGAETPDTITTYWYCIFKQEEGGNHTYVLEEGTNTYASRYDITTKSQSELADFYQNWERVMASNDVYVGTYPVTSVIPGYTVQGYTALLLEYNINLALETDASTQTSVVKGDVGAFYILPNGMGDYYGARVTMPSKNYVDAVANTKQDTLTAGEGISIQGTTISATGGGGGGNAWYGTQAEFDALQSVDTNTDYFISDPITWAEIADKPNVPTKISELPNDEGYVTDKEMKNYINERKIMHIVNSHNWYGTQAEYEALQTLNPDTNYHIEGDEVSLQMTFTFTDSTQAVYDVFVRPTV